jgi:hypothetical protein
MSIFINSVSLELNSSKLVCLCATPQNRTRKTEMDLLGVHKFSDDADYFLGAFPDPGGHIELRLTH